MYTDSIEPFELNHGSINEQKQHVRTLFLNKSLLNLALLWRRARLAIKQKQKGRKRMKERKRSKRLFVTKFTGI